MNQGKALRIGLFQLQSKKNLPQSPLQHSQPDTGREVEAKKQKKLRGSTRSILRLERTPGVQSTSSPLGGDGDLDKAGWLKKKIYEIKASSMPTISGAHVGDIAMLSSLQSYGQPQALLLQPVHPRKGSTIPSRTGRMKAPRSPRVTSRPAPAPSPSASRRCGAGGGPRPCSSATAPDPC